MENYCCATLARHDNHRNLLIINSKISGMLKDQLLETPVLQKCWVHYAARRLKVSWKCSPCLCGFSAACITSMSQRRMQDDWKGCKWCKQKQMRSTHSHLCIGGQEIQSSDVQAELLCLCELSEAGSHWHQLVPGDVCGQLENPLTAKKNKKNNAWIRDVWTDKKTRVSVFLTSCSTPGHCAAWNSMCHQVCPPEVWCYLRCCYNGKTLHCKLKMTF